MRELARWLKAWAWCLFPLVALILVFSASTIREAPAQVAPPPPSLVMADADAVTPTDAMSFYTGKLTSPMRTAVDVLVDRTASALGDDPAKIYAFVYNEMEVVPLFGVQKGARGCLIDKACTPFDQAHLLAELMRAADQHNSSISLNTRYEFRRVTMTPAQMAAWLGVSNTTALEQVLADGAVPFAPSGSNYEVLHLLVVITINGTDYRLDPSFKTYTAAIDPLSTSELDSAMGFSASTFMSQATSGSSTSTSGAPQLAAFNRGNVRSNLQAYSEALLTYIRTSYATADMTELLGGRRINRIGDTLSSPGYTLGSVEATFSNDVPYALRTKTTISVGPGGSGHTYVWYLDEYYGEELALIPQEQFPTQGSITYQFYRNGVVQGAAMTGAASALSVAFDHPYAARATPSSNLGTYLDRTISGGGTFHAGAIQFIIGGGRMTPDYGAYLDARSSAIEGFVEYQPPAGNPEPPPPIRVNAQRATKRRYAASFASQFGSAIQATRQIGQAEVVVHDLLITAHTVPIIGGGGPSPMTTIAAISVEGAVSPNALSGSASDTLAVRRATGALLGVLESSAVQQNMDSVYPISTAARFDWFTDSSESSSTNRRFYWANSSNWSYVSAQIQNDDFYDGSTTRAVAEAYINAGYTVIVPRSSYLGPGEYDVTVCAGPGVPASQCVFPGPERGGAIIALSPTGVAHVVTVQGGDVLKGGGGTNDAETNPTRIFSIPEDFLERQFTTRAEAYNVDMGTGTVSYTPPPDIVAGEGQYPYALSFQRSFRSGAPYDHYSSADDPPALYTWQPRFENSGWTSNFDHEARVANDGQDAFGERSPREATDTIVAIRVLIALSGDQGSDLDTLKYQLGGIHAMAWWAEQLVYNSINVTEGPQSRSFFRLADNTFSAPPGDPTQVELFGNRATYTKPLSPATLWSYNGMCTRLTARDASVSYFGPWNTGYSTCDTGAAGPAPSRVVKPMRFRRQTFREGIVVDFNDTTLSNNLGRSISLIDTGGGQPPNLSYIVRNDAAQSTHKATITLDLSSGPGVMSVTGADGNAWVYNGSSDANWRIFAPSNTTTPVTTFAFTSCTDPCPSGGVVRGQVASLTGAVGNAADTATANYFISSGRIGGMRDPYSNLTRTYFDHFGQPIRVINRLGYQTTTQYDFFRRATRVTNPEGDYVVYGYNQYHDRTDEEHHGKSGGVISTHTDYDATCGIPTLQRDGRGNETTTTLLSGRCLISAVSQPAVDDPLDGTTNLVHPVTQYTWNSYGQLLTRIDPTGRELRNTYNATSHYLETVTAENGLSDITTTFGRNAVGDITTVTDPLSHVFTGEYDPSRRITRYVAPSGTGAETRWSYNSDGLVSQVRQADGIDSDPDLWPTTTYAYWRSGRVQRMTRSDRALSASGVTQLAVTAYSYDLLNRAECTTVRMNPAVYGTMGNDACVLSTAGSAGNDRITKLAYDAEGHILTERRAFATSDVQVYATRSWTQNGQLDTVKDANNNLSDLVYDEFDRLYRLYFPSPTTQDTASTTDFEQYGYDNSNNRTSLRVRSGETISFCYDVLNREAQKDIPGGTSADVYSAYDLAGRRVFARFNSTPPSDCNHYPSDGVGVGYTYDLVGRVQTESNYTHTLTFGYDPDSNRTQITHPDGVNFNYTYDALNRVDQVQLNGSASGLSLIADYAYDPLSRRTSLTRGNGGVTSYGYDDLSRLTQLHHDLEAAGVTANDADWAFGYNPASQIISRTNVAAYEWAPTALNQTYVADGLNRYSSVGGTSISYSGDDGARGNLVSDGSRTFDYDIENRLLSVTENSATLGTLTYDPLGRLHTYTVGTTTTEFVYDSDRLVIEYEGGSIARRYVRGPGVDEPLIWYQGSSVSSGQNWLIVDRHGSVVAATNASGTATTYRYGPYGEPEAWSGTGGVIFSRFRYTGQSALPELRLYYYKSRVYDPRFGRFLQTDPAGYVDNLNLYAYVSNDPTNLTDPTGLGSSSDCGSRVNDRDAGASTCTAVGELSSMATFGAEQSETDQSDSAATVQPIGDLQAYDRRNQAIASQVNAFLDNPHGTMRLRDHGSEIIVSRNGDQVTVQIQALGANITGSGRLVDVPGVQRVSFTDLHFTSANATIIAAPTTMSIAGTNQTGPSHGRLILSFNSNLSVQYGPFTFERSSSVAYYVDGQRR